MHTPEEARDLRCPVAGDRCIADKCAMWRWGEFNSATKEEVVSAQDLGPGYKRVAWTTVKALSRGYCGLAGRPEIFR